MLHPFELSLMQVLLLFPGVFHLSLDLLKLTFHPIATFLVVSLQATVVVFSTGQLLLDLL